MLEHLSQKVCGNAGFGGILIKAGDMFPSKNQVGPLHIVAASSSTLPAMFIPVFQLIGISSIGASLFSIILQRTASPLPEINMKTV
jgi:hypothetical protein